jgi:hypothetical protein
MTVAHELVIRGFEVYVYESTRALDARGNKPLAIGGLARTQYFQASLKGSAQWEFSFRTEKPVHLEAATPGGSEQPRPFPSLWLKFLSKRSKAGEPQLTPRSRTDLKTALGELTPTSVEKLGDFTIHIQPFYDQGLNAIEKKQGSSKEYKLAMRRAKVVSNAVVARLEELGLSKELVHTDHPRAANTEFGQPPAGRDWVRVVLERAILPGEHGFRYFPSYYRHVFDTMRRIPLYDHNSLPTSRTTYDNLVALPNIGIASEKRPPFVLNWESYRFPDSVARAERETINLYDLGITPQDLFQFSLRVLRYMLTCPQRRARELENISWWQYLEGHNPITGGKLYCYSEAFSHLVKSSGRVLVALDGEWADARTTGNTYVQLLTDVLVPTEGTHATLNGPTSEAWFTHWHTHLHRLGVQFLHGTLEGFEPVAGAAGQRFVPRVALPPGARRPPMDPDAYYVVAVDVLAAEELTRQLPRIGVPAQLQGYTTLVPAQAGQPGSIPRDPRREPGRRGWDRLQTLSGIQYFFTTELNLIDGYLYLLDAPWGISAICSPIAWQHRPVLGLNRYQSLLSVDIGEWRENSPIAEGASAWKSTPMELGKETWRQLRATLEGRENQRPFLHFNPPEPAFVHIDQGLVFEGSDPRSARILRNDTPFLLPTVGDWQYRPGPEPWNPTPGARLLLRPTLTPGLWQAPHGGYWVHWDQIVFAGTYTRTFTRLTTMESANESARHAVNAILDHCGMREGEHLTRPVGERLHGELFPNTPLGDYCRIWDPEQNELRDLMLLRRQDAFNFEHHLPHPWDMLGVEALPSMLSQLWVCGRQVPSATAAPPDPFTQVESLLRELGKHAGPGGSEGLLELLRRIRTHLEESLKRGAAGAQPPPR